MMSEIFLLAEVIFLDTAKDSFKFPIANSIRTSFWLLDGEGSTFSEILIESNALLQIGRIYKIQVKLVDRAFLKGKIYPGAEFRLGVFPLEIANGKILEVYHKV